MINAVLFRTGRDLTGCRLQGHSGFAEAGSDICCAGASILTCTIVNALESVLGILPVVTEEDPDEGILAFELPPLDAERNGRAQILMGALRQGLEDLAAEFPQNVTFSIKERRKQP